MKHRAPAIAFGLIAAFQLLIALSTQDESKARAIGFTALCFAWASGDVSRKGSLRRRLGIGTPEAR